MKKGFFHSKFHLNHFYLFIAVSFVSAIAFYFYAFHVGARAFEWISIEGNGYNSFCDYFFHVAATYDCENLYTYFKLESWGCFPPLIYLMYRFFFCLTNPGGMQCAALEMKDVEYAMPVFLCYSIFSILLFLTAVKLWIPNYKKSIAFLTALFFSPPFFEGAIERGNSIFLVISLLLIALKFKDFPSKVKREIALILISVSAGIKIYPAVVGLLYIKEKRYREAIRLIAYGILFFFVPFAFFGGVKGFMAWFENVKFMCNMENVAQLISTYGRIQYIGGLIFSISQKFFGRQFFSVIPIISDLFLIFMLVLSFVSKSRIRAVIFLCAVMVFFPNNAYRYTLCYFCIPLAMYFSEYLKETTLPEKERANFSLWTFAILLFSLLFSIPMLFGMLTGFRVDYIGRTLTFVEAWIYIIAYLITALFTIWELVEQKNIFLRWKSPNAEKLYQNCQT